MSANTREDGPIQEAAARLQEAAAAKKCWACGCLHGALDTVGRTLPVSERSAVPEAALRTARTHLTPIGYDCLGFDVLSRHRGQRDSREPRRTAGRRGPFRFGGPRLAPSVGRLALVSYGTRHARFLRGITSAS
jgi:hypothetical protein